MTPALWAPVTVGAIELPHRLVMAPMTRDRSRADGVPTDLNREYHRQRACTPTTTTALDGQPPISRVDTLRPIHPDRDLVSAPSGQCWARLSTAVCGDRAVLRRRVVAGGRRRRPHIPRTGHEHPLPRAT
ncbi:hypothetical protein ABZ235_07055 [Streptomyces canus]|uniref:oxidoreductase n=1 Tax=Streptomyces canus TaxID=58343 RepID=UPI0033BD1985